MVEHVFFSVRSSLLSLGALVDLGHSGSGSCFCVFNHVSTVGAIYLDLSLPISSGIWLVISYGRSRFVRFAPKQPNNLNV